MPAPSALLAAAKAAAIAKAKQKAIAIAAEKTSKPLDATLTIGIEALFTALFIALVMPPIILLNMNSAALLGQLLGKLSPLGAVSSLLPISHSQSAAGQQVADAALKWAGKEFNPGQTAQCAFFVRHVLKEAGLNIPIAQLSWDGLRGGGEGLAAAFFGDEIGDRIPKNQLQPGDLVAFKNTYGNYPEGAITHVGIYVGNGMMVDRPTAAAPVKHRSIDVFGDKFLYGVRPRAYGNGSKNSANFESAMQFVANWEGGWANHGADLGGATNYGIASVYNPDVDVANLTPEGAKQIIYDRYWIPAGCDREPTAALATICLDTAVMHGVGGWQQFKAEAGSDARSLIAARKAYRYQRVEEDPSQVAFLTGWLNRDRALEEKVLGQII